MKKIIVFGAGNTAEKVSKYINKRTNVILCYADNDIKKHGKKLNGKEIIDPKFISSIDYIIIASIYWKEEIKPRTIFGKIICEFQIVKNNLSGSIIGKIMPISDKMYLDNVMVVRKISF